MVESIVGGGGHTSQYEGGETAKSNVSAALRIPRSAPVQALPYPSRRLSLVQERPELPSASASSDSSPDFHTDSSMSGGGGGGGGGGGSLRSRNAQKSWSKTPAGLSLSAPLLPSGDDIEHEHERSSAIPEDSMALDGSKHGSSNSSSSSESSVESGERRDKMSTDFAGSSGKSVGKSRGLQRRVSTRMLHCGTLTGSVKATELFKHPLASEGEGSVFPIMLPLAKRRAYEVDFIKQFDRLAINTNAGDFWTIIDATWMNNWVDFVMGVKGAPGPITNYKLYDQQSFLSAARRASLLVKHAVSSSAVSGVLASHPHLNIKKGLQRVKDYRVIHPLVWFIFREIYDTDGSPDIFRWKSDLYSDEVTGARKSRLVEEVHTKAVYQLRRFSARLKEAMEARSS